jgi:hypothetical protein
MIAERTRTALAQKKAQGALLGNRTNLVEAAAKGSEANRVSADAFATNVLPVIREIQDGGARSLRAIAAELTITRCWKTISQSWYYPYLND